MNPKRFPNTYIIIFAIIALCAIATWFVPGGEYVHNADGSTTFVEQPAQAQTWQIFTAFLNGFTKQAPIIIFVLIIGGSFWMVNQSRAVEVGIKSFLVWTRKLERNALLAKIGVNNLIMSLIMIVFSLFGAVFGMSEECIAFVTILVPLAISMGYDSITGLCLVYVAAHVGFSGAFLNPFTIGIAQDLASIPMFSGMEYRFFCWLVLTAILIAVVLCYAARVRRNPESSIMYSYDSYWRENLNSSDESTASYTNRSSWVSFAIAMLAISIFTCAYSAGCRISIGNSSFRAVWLLPAAELLFVWLSVVSLRKSVHLYVLNLLCFTMVYLIIGVLAFQWYLPEISALFLAMAITIGIATGLSGNDIVKSFLEGAKDIMSTALVIGLAAGIVIILRDGRIMDSILHTLELSLADSGKGGALSMMYGLQTLINLAIPSATAKAAITIPVMAPFADLIGLSRQATVLAFQFGDGFTNMITPTSGVLIAALAMAKIPYAVWVKWVWKFILLLIVLGFLLLLPTICMSLPGF